jgi:integrase
MTINPKQKSQKSAGVKAKQDTTNATTTANDARQCKNTVKRDSGELASATEYILAASKSAATKRAYACDVAHFLANGGRVPCEPEVVINYLTRFSQEKSVQTLSRRLIAIGQAHQEISAPSPINATVKNMMKGIRRLYGKRPDQKLPVRKMDLLDSLAMTDKRKPVQSARNISLLLLGFCGAFRRSELTALKLEDLNFEAGGVEIFIRRSKTDQINAGDTKFIPYANGRRCPVLALMHWLNVSGTNEANAFVFRSVNRHDQVAATGLTPQSVALIVKSCIRAIGGDEKTFAAHSLRSGGITAFAEAGHPIWSIKLVSLHKSDAQVSAYIRPLTKRNVASLL